MIISVLLTRRNGSAGRGEWASNTKSSLKQTPFIKETKNWRKIEQFLF